MQGANEAVIRMLISIGSYAPLSNRTGYVLTERRPDNVPVFIEAVKKREKVLSGFGHRVYKTSDPRSFIVRKTADEVFKVYAPSEGHRQAGSDRRAQHRLRPTPGHGYGTTRRCDEGRLLREAQPRTQR